MDAYKNKRVFELLNSLLCYRVCKIKRIVDNSNRLYDLSNKILGKRVTKELVKNSFGRVFTGGENLKEIKEEYERINRMGLGVIGCYSVEAQEGVELTK